MSAEAKSKLGDELGTPCLRLTPLCPSEPAELPAVISGDPGLSDDAKTLYGFVTARVLAAGGEWRSHHRFDRAALLEALGWGATRTVAASLDLKRKRLIEFFHINPTVEDHGWADFKPRIPHAAYSIQAWNNAEEAANPTQVTVADLRAAADSFIAATHPSSADVAGVFVSDEPVDLHELVRSINSDRPPTREEVEHHILELSLEKHLRERDLGVLESKLAARLGDVHLHEAHLLAILLRKLSETGKTRGSLPLIDLMDQWDELVEKGGDSAESFDVACAAIQARGFVLWHEDGEKGVGFEVLPAAVAWAESQRDLELAETVSAVTAQEEALNRFLEELDHADWWDKLPDVCLFHEAVTGNEEIGPATRRLMVTLMASSDWLKARPEAADCLDWTALFKDSGKSTIKLAANLIRWDYALPPEHPKETGFTNFQLRDPSQWTSLYEAKELAAAKRVGRHHREKVRRAQLTLPDAPCPCGSGNEAGMCCQVHSKRHAMMLLHGTTLGGIAGLHPRLSSAPMRPAKLPGRNDPCLCWSGRKFKKCCSVSGITSLTEWMAASYLGGTQ